MISMLVLNDIAPTNRVGKVRRETVDGRQYLVAPIVGLVCGVLSGSKGALAYFPEDTEAAVKKWDNRPILIGHPTNPVSNIPLSANGDGVFERQGIGYLAGSKFDGQRLTHQGYFDEELTRLKEPTIYNALLRGQALECSTGLFSANEPARGTYKGRPYDAVARLHVPDHMAILVQGRGACAISDGCGLNMNRRY